MEVRSTQKEDETMKEYTVKGKPVRVYVCDSEDEIASQAADVVMYAIRRKPHLALGLATGSTPVPLYRKLAEKNRAGEISFAKVRTYNLDEYFPIDPASPLSFRGFMRDNLFSKIDLPEEAIHIPRGDAPDADGEAARYEAELDALGGVDIQILGIGSDGHIGFNEPADRFIYPTHATALTEQTRRDNARFFNALDEVPTHAITMGIGAIMRAKKCIFIATGKNKAPAVKSALLDDPSPACQASVLQFHPDTVFLLDRDAASLLP